MRVVHIVSRASSAAADLKSAVAALVSFQIDQGLDADWKDASETSWPTLLNALRGAEIVHVHATTLAEARLGPGIGTLLIGTLLLGRNRVLSIHGSSSQRSNRKRMFRAIAARVELARYRYVAAAEAPCLTEVTYLRKHGIGVIADAKDFIPLYSRLLGTPKRRILNCHVDVFTVREAIATIETAIETRQGRRIAFVNAHLATEAARDPSVSKALANFALFNDGIGIDLASIILFGRRFPENLNGTDFIPALLDALRPGARLYLLGASADVITAAASFYASRWPHHSIVGFHHGFFGEADTAAVVKSIRESRCDIVLVGMGCPRQEFWIAQNIPFCAPVGIGVGALFDFQTGRFARAPHFVRRIHLEWVWRLCNEPQRLWRRYLVGGSSFLVRVANQWLRGDRV